MHSFQKYIVDIIWRFLKICSMYLVTLDGLRNLKIINEELLCTSCMKCDGVIVDQKNYSVKKVFLTRENMFSKSLTIFYLSNFLPILYLQYIQYCKSTANASLWVRGNFLCNSYLLTFAFLVFVLCKFFSVFLLHYIRPN